MSYWFEKYIVEVTAIFQSVLVIFSNSELIVRLQYVICLLTEHGIALSQTKQFDVLDLYKTRTQDELSLILFFF